MTPLACSLSGIVLLCCTIACIIFDDVWYRQCERKGVRFDEDDFHQAAALGKLSELRDALDAEENGLQEVRD
ncbi:hypothetical protein LCGC14_0754300 [marine sediment metagenome]|uniref:Uncharacterized protein n=1 Tax=marine sediment metagenome TaxID=412755 RepID=A0A0F9Q344_9ZZZZ